MANGMRTKLRLLSFSMVPLLAAPCPAEEKEMERLKRRRKELQAREAELVDAQHGRHSNMLNQQVLQVRTELQLTVSEIARCAYEGTMAADRQVPGMVPAFELQRLLLVSKRERLRWEHLRLSSGPGPGEEVARVEMETAVIDRRLARLLLDEALDTARRGPQGAVSVAEIRARQSAFADSEARLSSLRERQLGDNSAR